MAHQILWTADILNEFISRSELSQEEERVIRTRVEKKWSVTQQALDLNCSESTIHTIIKRLKRKYDAVADGERLPYRQFNNVYK